MSKETLTSWQFLRAHLMEQGPKLFYARFKLHNHVVKKNGRPVMRNARTGKSFIGKSQKLKGAENQMMVSIMNAKSSWQKAYNLPVFKPIDEPVWVMFVFYYPEKDFFTKKGEISRTLPDLSNLYELPQDCLQKAGVLENDTLIHSHDCSRRTAGQHLELEIFIMKYNIDMDEMRRMARGEGLQLNLMRERDH